MAYIRCCKSLKIMADKILKTGYDNLMLAYYVNYEDNDGNRYTEYFDTIKERNDFIRSIQ